MAIFVLALMIRLAYLLESSRNPTFDVPITDSASYLSLAESLVDGGEAADPLFWQSVFYPLFLAGVYRLTDDTIWAAKLIQILVSSFTCVMTYWLGRKVRDTKTGVVAGVITALYGPLIFFDGELLAAGWASFWSVALLLLFLRAVDRFHARNDVVLGACGALSVLTVPSFLPFFVVAGLWLLAVRRRNGQRPSGTAAGLLAIGAGFGLIATPVGVLNQRTTGHFGFLPATGGINLFIGNNPYSAETVAYRPGRDWYELATWPRRAGVTGGMWEEDRFFHERTLEYVANEPADFLRGLTRKSLEFVGSRELPRTLDVYVFREWSVILSALVWKVGGFGFPFGLFLPLVVVGVIHYGWRIPGPFWLLVGFYSASIILVFVSARYRAPLIPVLAVPAAAGVLTLVAGVRGRRWRRLWADVGILVVTAVAISVPGPFPAEQVNYAAEVHYFVGNRLLKQGRLREAVVRYERALEFAPNDADIHARYAEALLAGDRVEEAIHQYREALRIRPDSAVNRACLGHAYFRAGKTERAVESYREALEIFPEYAEAQTNLGVALHHLGRVEEAIGHYRHAARLSPEDAIARHNLGMALAEVGELEEAERELRRAVEMNAGNADMRYALATVLDRRGARAAAVRTLEEALRLDPRHAPAQAMLESLRTHSGPQ